MIHWNQTPQPTVFQSFRRSTVNLFAAILKASIWGQTYREFMGISGSGGGEIDEIGNSPMDYTRAYTADDLIWKCVDVRAKALMAIPLKVMAPSSKDETKLIAVDHDSLDVLQRTNPFGWVTYPDTIGYTMGSLDLHGHTAWIFATNGRNLIPTEIYYRPPTTYEPLPDRARFFGGLKIRSDGAGEDIIPPERVFYVHTMSMAANPLTGTSKIAVLRNAINLRQYSQASNRGFFRNNARPDMIISGDWSMVPEVVNRIRRMINTYLLGDNRKGPLILGGNATAHLLTATPKDAEWVMQQRLSQEDICKGFGVPLFMVNNLERATYENIRTANQAFYHHTMIPEGDWLALKLTNGYLYRWPDAIPKKLQMMFDYSKVEGLSEDLAQIWERFLAFMREIVSQVEKGLLLPQEGANAIATMCAEIGVDPKPWTAKLPHGMTRLIPYTLVPEDQLSVQAAMNILGARAAGEAAIENVPGAEHARDRVEEARQRKEEAAQNEPKPDPPVVNPEKEPPAKEPAKILRMRKTKGPNPLTVRDAHLAPIQAKVTKRYKRYFQDLKTQALRWLRGGKAKWGSDVPTGDPWDREQAQQDAVDLGTAAVQDSGQAAYEAAKLDFGLDVEFDLKHPWLDAYMGQRLDKIKGIEQQTLDDVKDTLTEGSQNAEDFDSLINRVSIVLQDRIQDRSEVIARTETIQAYGAASLAAYDDAGVQQAEMFDGDGDPECAAVNGMVVSLDEAQQLMADEHPNGTRAVGPVIDTGQGSGDNSMEERMMAMGDVILLPGAITVRVLP